jgi:hypothetical protein
MLRFRGQSQPKGFFCQKGRGCMPSGSACTTGEQPERLPSVTGKMGKSHELDAVLPALPLLHTVERVQRVQSAVSTRQTGGGPVWFALVLASESSKRLRSTRVHLCCIVWTQHGGPKPARWCTHLGVHRRPRGRLTRGICWKSWPSSHAPLALWAG